VSEKCLGTEVPVDCKSVRIRLMVSQGCDEINLIHSEGLWVYKVCASGRSKRKSQFMTQDTSDSSNIATDWNSEGSI
jgi:hypothetical protein